MLAAARRADASEVELIRARVHRAHGGDLRSWRRIVDDAVIELAALSQSARLTREQMRLQAELSPFFALVDREPAAGNLDRLGAEVAAGRADPVAAAAEMLRLLG